MKGNLSEPRAEFSLVTADSALTALGGTEPHSQARPPRPGVLGPVRVLRTRPGLSAGAGAGLGEDQGSREKKISSRVGEESDPSGHGRTSG